MLQLLSVRFYHVRHLLYCPSHDHVPRACTSFPTQLCFGSHKTNKKSHIYLGDSYFKDEKCLVQLSKDPWSLLLEVSYLPMLAFASFLPQYPLTYLQHMEPAKSFQWSNPMKLQHQQLSFSRGYWISYTGVFFFLFLNLRFKEGIG